MSGDALTPSAAARLFPRGVGDPFCPDGAVIATSTDHRLLWHIECLLAVNARSGSDLDRLRHDLKEYLTVRCEHHWHLYGGDDLGPDLWQCMWCNGTQEEAPSSGQVCKPEDAIEHWPVVADLAP